MKLLVINPNTSPSMTAGIAAAARAAAAPGTSVAARCPSFGPQSIEGHFEDTIAAAGVAEQAYAAAAEGFDACVIAERLVQRYGFERSCRGIHGTDIPVLALEDCGKAVLARVEGAARAALARDRSEAIVLGCAGMAALCRTLQQRLGVPVIDGVAVAVKLAEALVALDLRTAKHGD